MSGRRLGPVRVPGVRSCWSACLSLDGQECEGAIFGAGGAQYTALTL